MHEKKYIVISGGVISGLGKGIAAASIGHILSSKYRVIPIKCDGYLNVDPGTMNPLEHGEVFVLDDGSEVDMDFGHYERFLKIKCKGSQNLTMGKVFEKVRTKERKGYFLGKTVQMIPHVADLIKEWWIDVAKKEKGEIVLIEIGGTVGDMENELYIEAARKLRLELGKENVLFAHLTYIPKPTGVNEQKSKPTQQSISLLRQRGINPDIILARCSEKLNSDIVRKISTMSNLCSRDIISAVDVDDVYKIPSIFESQGLLERLIEKLQLDNFKFNNPWKNFLDNKSNKETKRIGILGKYTALEDSYASVVEAIKHACAKYNFNPDIEFIASETITSKSFKRLSSFDGIIIPGGFGSRGVEGKIEAIKIAREHSIPFLGLCYGLQLAVVEFARTVCGLKGANSTEIDPKTDFPVIDILEDKRNLKELGGTLRKGSYDALLSEKSLVYNLYRKKIVSERHRHRYEVNPEFHNILIKNGLFLCGKSRDGKLVEFIELKDHPFFVATQSHPELKSTPEKPAILFDGFVKSFIKNKKNN